jgi:lysophospholipase L1-like esterase
MARAGTESGTRQKRLATSKWWPEAEFIHPLVDLFAGRPRTVRNPVRRILVKDHPEYWSQDGVHFNGKGIAVQAEQVTKRIVENLK